MQVALREKPDARSQMGPTGRSRHHLGVLAERGASDASRES